MITLNSGAKIEVKKFDETGNFGLWQTRVKDLLAQQGILKVLRAKKPEGMDDLDWEELQQWLQELYGYAWQMRLCTKS